MSSSDFRQHEIVSTVYGTGYIVEVRGDCYVVKLTCWFLAQGQSPTLYLQKEAMTKIPGCLKGATVKTPYGTGVVQKVRADGTHIVKALNWKLANDSRAIMYLQPSQVSLIQTSGLQEGDDVMTVYGRGFIEKKRANDVVVKLYNWKLAQGQSPTCYLNHDACVKIHGFREGDVGNTVFGLVKINEIRRSGVHVGKALHWTLADGTNPTLYLAPEAFALLSIKP